MSDLDVPFADNLAQAELPAQLEKDLRQMNFISVEQLYALMTSPRQEAFRLWFQKFGVDCDKLLEKLRVIIPEDTLARLNAVQPGLPPGENAPKN